MSNEIENSWIDIESACGGSFGAYVSLPPAGFGPGLLVIQEIFGVNDHIKNVCDQYALDGFVAVAPDVFWRQEPRVELSYDSVGVAKGLQLFNGLNIDIAAAELQRAVEAIRHIPSCTGKVGAIGFWWWLTQKNRTDRSRCGVKIGVAYKSFQARSFAESSTASQTLAVSRASRKVGLHGVPSSRLFRKSAT